MAQHGATLQSYNQELVKCLEDLRAKRSDLLKIVNKDEQEKKALEKNLESLQEKLSNVNASLQKHKTLCDSYDKAIRETEFGFKKIVESSQMLLNLAQQEASKLNIFKENTSPNKLSQTNSYQYD